MSFILGLFSVVGLLFFTSCEDETNDNAPELVDDPPTEVTLWGEVYSVENTIELDLEDTGITGSIPSDIGYLKNLEWLDLSENELTGSIPSEIGNLTNLNVINIKTAKVNMYNPFWIKFS